MAQVKEKTEIEHFRKNYDLHKDYLVVLKHDLKGETIKPLLDVKVEEKSTLGTVLDTLETKVRLLEEENKVLKGEIKETNAKLEELRLVFERTIKELITRWEKRLKLY